MRSFENLKKTAKFLLIFFSFFLFTQLSASGDYNIDFWKVEKICPLEKSLRLVMDNGSSWIVDLDQESVFEDILQTNPMALENCAFGVDAIDHFQVGDRVIIKSQEKDKTIFFDLDSSYLLSCTFCEYSANSKLTTIENSDQFGTFIKLDDGSLWSVHLPDFYVTQGWDSEECVVPMRVSKGLLSDPKEFVGYPFCLINFSRFMNNSEGAIAHGVSPILLKK